MDFREIDLAAEPSLRGGESLLSLSSRDGGGKRKQRHGAAPLGASRMRPRSVPALFDENFYSNKKRSTTRSWGALRAGGRVSPPAFCFRDGESSNSNEEWDERDESIVIQRPNEILSWISPPPPPQPRRHVGRNRPASCFHDSESSNSNEEWDWSKVIRRPHKIPPGRQPRRTGGTIGVPQPQPRVKCKRARFAKTQEVIPSDAIEPLDEQDLWYKASDHRRFTTEAAAWAKKARRLMEYASMNEHTYKSSVGLTSSQALREYLSCPQEIVGIEYLLAGQDTARASLRHHHRIKLLEEQRLLKKEGGDPNLLAERMGNGYSAISSNMARERANYAVLLD